MVHVVDVKYGTTPFCCVSGEGEQGRIRLCKNMKKAVDF